MRRRRPGATASSLRPRSRQSWPCSTLSAFKTRPRGTSVPMFGRVHSACAQAELERLKTVPASFTTHGEPCGSTAMLVAPPSMRAQIGPLRRRIP